MTRISRFSRGLFLAGTSAAAIGLAWSQPALSQDAEQAQEQEQAQAQAQEANKTAPEAPKKPVPMIRLISDEAKDNKQSLTFVSLEEVDLERSLMVVSKEEFEKQLRLDQITENGVQDQEQMKEFIEAYQPKDDQGRPVTAVVYDNETGRILGASDAVLTINSTFENKDGKTALVVSAKDENGQPVKLEADQIWVGATSGQQEPVILESFSDAQAPMIVEILVDSSGSMKPYMDQVLDAARYMLDGLPDHMRCGVMTFGENVIDFAKDGYPGCGADNFKLNVVKADGGTPLFAALEAAYSKLNDPQYEDHQKAVVALSDGEPTDMDHKDKVVPLQNGINTIFFWLGKKDAKAEQSVSPFATTFVASGQDAVSNLTQYFDSFQDAIDEQAVIILPPSADTSHIVQKPGP